MLIRAQDTKILLKFRILRLLLLTAADSSGSFDSFQSALTAAAQISEITN